MDRAGFKGEGMKKAIITGGSFYHQNLFKVCGGRFGDLFSARLYLPNLYKEELCDFDYVVLASRLNTSFLMQNASKLLDYINNGGNMVLLGGVDCDFLPHLDFKPTEVNFWWWLHKGADLPLYAFDVSHRLWDFLRINECKWHYHGVFKDNDKYEKILVNEIGESIICKSHHFKGNLYLTSLDPDFHIGQGFMPITIPFFEKYMRWIETDILEEK